MLDFGFYNMDCMKGMAEFPDNYFELAIVDPPYGINVGKMSIGKGGGVAPEKNRSAANAKVGGGLLATPKIYHAFDDTEIPQAEYFNELKRVSVNQIIWGGNYFLKYLGETNCMIIWDKGRRGLNFADCEIAWTSFKQPARIFEYKWNGLLQEDMKNKEIRIHPTQKPVALYKWLLEHYAKEGDKILDTHVGSASSLIACHYAHCPFVGFEIDETYYQQAVERLARQTAQIALF